jgi:hypothetical protein
LIIAFFVYQLSLSKKPTTFFLIFFTDPAKILSVTSSAVKSWIGQTVTLKCVSDGVPTPTLTWYKPDGNELNTVTAKESTMEVSLNDEQDFGEYKCVAYNGLDPLNDASIAVLQISMCQHIDKIYIKFGVAGVYW